jgi:hypothetical protein
MSSPSPEKPAWFAAKRQKKSAAGQPAQKPLRMRKPKLARIEVNPEDVEDHGLSFWKSLVRDRKHGYRGLLLSLVIHTVLLIVLAFVIVTIRSQVDDYVFELGWTPAEVAMARDARGPVNVGAIEFNPDAPEKRPPLKLPNQPGSGDDEDKHEQASAGVNPVDVKELLSLRTPERRKRVMDQHGGNESTERAIKAALLWLKRQQREGGNWSLHDGYPDAGERTMRTDTGATALALLAFLGAGQTHTFGDHKETVKAGIDWLIRNQKQDGNFHDRYELGHQSTFYAHAQSVIALSEALLLTGDESLREPAQKGIEYLMVGQNPVQGGWKYRPADDLTVGDLSVTGWALMALHTARAAGLEVPETSYTRAAVFLDSVAEQQGTRYKYMPSDPPDRVTAAMTAEGLLCRQYLGAPRDNLAMQSGVAWLLAEENVPEWNEGRRNVYEWYYTAQMLHNFGGEEWREWFQTVQREILRTQKKSGSTRKGKDTRGSWAPLDPRGAYHEYAAQAGRLYLTAMCVLILETPYRHAPIYGE